MLPKERLLKKSTNLTIYDFSMLKNTMDISALESFFPDEVEEYKKLRKRTKENYSS